MADFVVKSVVVWLAITVPAAVFLCARSPDSPVEFGRRVYAGEGCVHCHSQYVRPTPADRERWGNYAVKPDALTGNRRQGPDLATIGRRAGAEYLRLHLEHPEKITPGTVMPSYSHLFAPGDSRGENLIAYLLSLRGVPVEGDSR